MTLPSPVIGARAHTAHETLRIAARNGSTGRLVQLPELRRQDPAAPVGLSMVVATTKGEGDRPFTLASTYPCFLRLMQVMFLWAETSDGGIDATVSSVIKCLHLSRMQDMSLEILRPPCKHRSCGIQYHRRY